MNSIEWTFQLRFIVALALGLLVGLEREGTKSKRKLALGGIRTFPIISMLGFGCAWLYQLGVTLMLPIGLLSISVLAGVSYFSKVRTEKVGATSEITALLTFVVGALALMVDIWVSMAIGIINTMLLSEKAELENIVEKLDRAEFTAVLKFLLVTLIILPVLPNKNFTDFELNPSQIWQIVILVSTIGFIGYLLSKFLGQKVGLYLSGLIGGIVSSTAVSIANGRIAKKDPTLAISSLQGSIAASSIMYIKFLVIIFVISPVIAQTLWLKMIFLFAVGIASSYIKHDPSSETSAVEEELKNLQNPFEIKPAMLFGILFVAISVLTKIINQYVGAHGIFTFAGVVGIANIDPFIFSIAHSSWFDPKLVSTAIIVAMLSNTVIKGIYFGYFVPSLRTKTFQRFGILALAHIPLLFF
ncbi:MAG: DUF4010 domain-containing protein [Bacteroidetes bacterium]|nr:DUF4010 domain-containing protein [Bacteroidota bacterium]